MACVLAGLVVVTAGATLPLRYRAAEDGVERCLVESGTRIPVATLERCAQTSETDYEILAQLADRYAEADQFARAEETYRRVIALDPDYAEVRLKLGRLLLQRGAHREAAEQARRALTVQPNRDALVALLRDAEGDE